MCTYMKFVLQEVLQVSINQEFPDGEPGCSNALDSALARPYRVLIEQGRSTGRINHVFYSDSTHSYILGSLCNADSGRLIFFPGVLGRKVAWDTQKGKLPAGAMMDHITLEPDFKSWHLTVFREGKKDKQRPLSSRCTVEIEPGLDYWFGMSIRSANLLEKAYQRHTFSFSVPSTDIKRYSRIILSSKQRAIHNNTCLPKEDAGDHEFLHFDFLLDQRVNRNMLPMNVVFAPVDKPALKSFVARPPTFHMRKHNVSIDCWEGKIIVIVTKHAGDLAEEVFVIEHPKLGNSSPK